MNLAAIYHRSTDQYCYALNEDELAIQLKTGKDVKAVSIIYGDPFSGGILGGDWSWAGNELEVEHVNELALHLWWSIIVRPPFKRCKYYFKLTFENGETIYYLEEGFKNSQELLESKTQLSMFVFPWMNENDVFKVPEWATKTIWYQIFPDRFHKVNNPSSNLSKWQEGPVTNDQIYGGNLEGIIEKLPYLKDLGISGIYLNPIFKAHATHKYDTIDYLKVDEMFGDNQTLIRLVQRAHELGIKVMLDGVFNHSGIGFFAWQDILKHGKESQYFDWYMINEYPFSNQTPAKNKDYYAFAFVDQMPKLNTNNQAVIDYFLNVCTYWVEEFKIDAIRLDVANELSHDFNRQLRARMKSIDPDIYILGEIWNDSISWLRGDEYDSVMNYPLTDTLYRFFLNKKQTTKDLMIGINECYAKYMNQTNQVLFNLLDSHDTMRLIHKVNHSIDDAKQMLMLMMVMPGSPSLYYGTEIFLEGSNDPDCRRCMPWDKIEQLAYDDSITFIKKLTSIRAHYDICRSQSYQMNTSHARVIHLEKHDGKYTLELIMNASEAVVVTELLDPVFAYKVENNQILPGGFILSIQKA